MQFRRYQDEIQQLVEGESLYGDPASASQHGELLQSVLDALERRELRLKMKQKG